MHRMNCLEAPDVRQWRQVQSVQGADQGTSGRPKLLSSGQEAPSGLLTTRYTAAKWSRAACSGRVRGCRVCLAVPCVLQINPPCPACAAHSHHCPARSPVLPQQTHCSAAACTTKNKRSQPTCNGHKRVENLQGAERGKLALQLHSHKRTATNPIHTQHSCHTQLAS